MYLIAASVLAFIFCMLFLREYHLRKMAEEKVKNDERFKALSHDALERNNRTFLDLANASLEKFHERAKGDLEKKEQSFEELVKPVKETLTKLDLGMRQLEKERKGRP